LKTEVPRHNEIVDELARKICKDLDIPLINDANKLYSGSNGCLDINYHALNFLVHYTALNQIYIDARYPGSLGTLPEGPPAAEDAKSLFEFAREVYAMVNNVLQT
jgi:hypothetical protein